MRNQAQYSPTSLVARNATSSTSLPGEPELSEASDVCGPSVPQADAADLANSSARRRPGQQTPPTPTSEDPQQVPLDSRPKNAHRATSASTENGAWPAQRTPSGGTEIGASAGYMSGLTYPADTSARWPGSQATPASAGSETPYVASYGPIVSDTPLGYTYTEGLRWDPASNWPASRATPSRSQEGQYGATSEERIRGVAQEMMAARATVAAVLHLGSWSRLHPRPVSLATDRRRRRSRATRSPSTRSGARWWCDTVLRSRRPATRPASPGRAPPSGRAAAAPRRRSHHGRRWCAPVRDPAPPSLPRPNTRPPRLWSRARRTAAPGEKSTCPGTSR